MKLALLTTEEVALLLGRTEQALRQERYEMTGLPYIKFNRWQVRYLLSDVMAALAGPGIGEGEDDGEEKETGAAQACCA